MFTKNKDIQRRRAHEMIYKYRDKNISLEKVGGKAYNLAHLSKMSQIMVP